MRYWQLRDVALLATWLHHETGGVYRFPANITLSATAYELNDEPMRRLRDGISHLWHSVPGLQRARFKARDEVERSVRPL
ncbi:hypothetical protein KCP70_04900 [Salmonella enterica subsp. enterica]|nr:hypothetical protein KCP70_04900 [Salmonella enterica subsp. enterica]